MPHMYHMCHILTYSRAHCVERKVQAFVIGVLCGVANCVTHKVSERCSSSSDHCDTETSVSGKLSFKLNISPRLQFEPKPSSVEDM